MILCMDIMGDVWGSGVPKLGVSLLNKGRIGTLWDLYGVLLPIVGLLF